jgi:hypothetical protein
MGVGIGRFRDIVGGRGTGITMRIIIGVVVRRGDLVVGLLRRGMMSRFLLLLARDILPCGGRGV